MRRPVVALLSDFGTRDGYVAAMKGVLLRLAPGVELVDISHEIPAGDILAGAWVLASVWQSFPDGTVFVCVVDPEVGSQRKAVAFALEGKLGVGPDNGIFTLVLHEGRPDRAVELTRREHWQERVSEVFHGRDIFAPVAAALARGVRLEELGQPIDSLALLPLARPSRGAGGRIEGHVIHVDRFGNAITDIRAELLPEAPLSIEVSGKRVTGLVRYYAEAQPDTLIALVNSAGHLELAIRGGSAAQLAGIERGALVVVSPLSAAAALR